MNKDLTPLEAFNCLTSTLSLYNIEDETIEDIVGEELNIIETALKDHTKIKELFEKFGIEDVYNLEVRLMNYEIGEKVLKDYGLTLAEFRRACLTYAQFKNCKADKNLKALEIINEKNVCIATLKDSDSLEEYNDVICYHKVHSMSFAKPLFLEQDEFDLLKEVLK